MSAVIGVSTVTSVGSATGVLKRRICRPWRQLTDATPSAAANSVRQLSVAAVPPPRQ